MAASNQAFEMEDVDTMPAPRQHNGEQAAALPFTFRTHGAGGEMTPHQLTVRSMAELSDYGQTTHDLTDGAAQRRSSIAQRRWYLIQMAIGLTVAIVCLGLLIGLVVYYALDDKNNHSFKVFFPHNGTLDFDSGEIDSLEK